MKKKYNTYETAQEKAARIMSQFKLSDAVKETEEGKLSVEDLLLEIKNLDDKIESLTTKEEPKVEESKVEEPKVDLQEEKADAQIKAIAQAMGLDL